MLSGQAFIEIFLLFSSVIAQVASSDLVCPSGWVPLVSSCFYFSKTKTTWSNGRSSCRNFGGDLFVPTNSKQNNVVTSAARQKSHKYPWIGLLRHKDGKFYTIHGLKPSYTNWNQGEPNNSGNNENCGHVLITMGGRGKWNDVSCRSSYHYICQMAPLKKKELHCYENRMILIVLKSLFSRISSANELQLLDSSCRPRESKFYYHFVTTLTGCGTQITSDNQKGTVTFFNKVIERTSAFGGSVTRSKEIQFPFSCKYSQSYVVSSSALGMVDVENSLDNVTGGGNISLVMIFFKDNSFANPLINDPSLNKRLYVEVKLNSTKSATQSSLGIKLNECYATSKSTQVKYKHLLIQRGCGKDKTVQFHQSPGSSARFSFMFFRFRGLHHYTTRVHCRVSVCDKKKKRCQSKCRNG